MRAIGVRLGIFALSLTVASVVIFAITQALPGDIARVLLGDGASWTAQGLAEHAGVSKRTALRALRTLVERGAVVRDYLLAQKLASERLFLGAVKPQASGSDWKPGAELKLDMR